MKKLTLELAITKAKEYKTKKLFIHNCQSLYVKALKEGWFSILDQYLEDHQHKLKTKTFEECQTECLKFKTITDFCHHAPTHFRVAKREGWLKEISKHMGNSLIKEDKNDIKKLVKDVSGYKPSGYWTLKRTKEELIKNGLIEKREIFLKRRDLYEVIYRNNWWEDLEITFIKGKKTSKYTFENCQEAAKKYNTISAFQSGDRNLYWAASNKGWLEIICKHMTVSLSHKKAGKSEKVSNWSDDELFIEAKKYTKVSQFQAQSRNQYYASYRRGPEFFAKVTAHMRGNQFSRAPKYTEEDLRLEALKFKSRYEFYKKSTKMYNIIIKRNLHHFFDHMPKNVVAKQTEQTEAHPQFKKLISALGIDEIKYDKFFDGDRPDFVLIHNNYVIVVELKSDKEVWSVSKITDQLERYHKSFSDYYKDKLLCYPILTSPVGKYGLSFTEAIAKIKELFNL